MHDRVAVSLKLLVLIIPRSFYTRRQPVDIPVQAEGSSVRSAIYERLDPFCSVRKEDVGDRLFHIKASLEKENK